MVDDYITGLPNYKRGTNVTLTGDENFPSQIDIKELVGIENFGSVSSVRSTYSSFVYDANVGIIKFAGEFVRGLVYFKCPPLSSSATGDINVFIDPAISTVELTLSNNPAKKGMYYSQQLDIYSDVHDSLNEHHTTLPVTWSIVSGSLPPGLSLNASTGEISGTPT